MMANNQGFSFDMPVNMGLFYRNDIRIKLSQAISQKGADEANIAVVKNDKMLIYPNPAKGYFFYLPIKIHPGLLR